MGVLRGWAARQIVLSERGCDKPGRALTRVWSYNPKVWPTTFGHKPYYTAQVPVNPVAQRLQGLEVEGLALFVVIDMEL